MVPARSKSSFSQGRTGGMPCLKEAKAYHSSLECQLICRSGSRMVPRSSGRWGGTRVNR